MRNPGRSSFSFRPRAACVRGSDIRATGHRLKVGATGPAVLLLLALASATASATTLLDAKERGIFNMGPAKGEVSVPTDTTPRRDILQLDFTAPAGTAVGLWTKAYPAELNRDAVDRITVRTGPTEPDLASRIGVTLEIKGASGTQRIPVTLKPDWQTTAHPVDWTSIGSLNEVVLVVEAPVGEGTATGTLLVGAAFSRTPWLVRAGGVIPIRMGAVVLLALLIGGLCHGLRRNVAASVSERTGSTRSRSWLRGVARDISIGLAVTVLIASLFLLPAPGWSYLAVALAGALVGGLLRFAFTGKLSAAGEACRDVLITGLLAGSAGSGAVWQAPGTWADLLQLSTFGAGLFIVLYHAANLYLLATREKHIGWIGAGLIAGIPYVSGLLLALQPGGLMATLGHAAFVGRVLMLFMVNVFVANALALITRRRFVKGAAVHAWLLVPAVATMAAPFAADLGSGAMVAAWPAIVRSVVAVFCTMLSQAALWAEAFMLTGIMLDGMRGKAPDSNVVVGNARSGILKGAVYSGILMGTIQLAGLLVAWSPVRVAFHHAPHVLLSLGGAMVYPFIKTIIESFDGSQSFFGRVRRAYGNPVLFLRGFTAGAAIGIAVTAGLPAWATGPRALFGAIAGAAAFAGASLVRDLLLSFTNRGWVKTVRLYLVEGMLGAFIGAALAFYFDQNQIPIVLQKFKLYTSFGMDPKVLVDACNAVRMTRPDEFRALVNNWGYIRLSPVHGGAKFLLNEAIIGVSVWGIAAWLFAINRAFLQALFQREWSPVKRIPSREGLAEMMEGTIRVMRWGLWMSPIIFTFLRPMGEPTWYNQDGAVRTLFATANSLFMGGEAFQEWSLGVFTGILVYGGFRILIFIDHMGLRVATLVNLSFVGMDRLDERLARFIGRDAAALYIPEGVKRFTTWAPLLIPFYLPAGADWDRVWNGSQAVLASSSGGFAEALAGLGLPVQLAIAFGAAAIVAGVSRTLRSLHTRGAKQAENRLTVSNITYEVEAKASGELNSRLIHEGIALNRPSFEGAEPAGRALFVTETNEDAPNGFWPIIGNAPEELFPKSRLSRDGNVLTVVNVNNDIETTVAIALPDSDDSVETWNVSIKNLADRSRRLKLSPYIEWLLHDPGQDRNHTQYNRLYPEMSYDVSLNGILALHRYTKKVGILAAGIPPEGFLTVRVDFIGRAGTIWDPRALRTMRFHACHNTEAYPTFDPIGALLVDVPVEARGTVDVRLMMGCADSREEAASWIRRHLAPAVDETRERGAGQRRRPLIGHGEVLPGTPLPYTEYLDNGETLRVLTPFTPRPFDHSMSNAGGHVLCVTNRGLHCSSSVNAQQNRLTTDWADLVGREMPSEAIYLFDPRDGAWYSPTYEPLRDGEAKHDVRFGSDGSATFVMRKGDLETELVTHVPANDPTGVYLLTIRNKGERPKSLRVAPYFQIALAHSPEMAGPLNIERDEESGALFFENPRNTFRSGPAFVAMTETAERVALTRGAFFGRGRSFAHPLMVENARPDSGAGDGMPCAGLLTTLDIPTGGERTLAILLGQSDTRAEARACIAKLGNVEAARESLRETRDRWTRFKSTIRVKTSNPAFDGYLQWMKYQALAERIWARKGFYQASGAFGFRDQLQDTVNLVWADPGLARRQLLLHASQQFIEGDVVHWFFTLQDGRTGFASRSHASDNLLWLGWGVSEYVNMTGDKTLLDETVTYLDAETPLPPLPEGKQGMGFCPHRSPLADTVYRHVLRAIDLVFDRRMGVNGLPLIGTGDWNDGLDEIGSEGRGESVWLAFFLTCILKNMLVVIDEREGADRRAHYETKLGALQDAVEKTWRGDRYLRAIHDDGTEIGVEGAGYWETDALTAAWAVYAGGNRERARTAVDTALRVLESDNVISLGYPPLREDTKPYLGRSSRYPEGVRENGMYSHGVQWLVRACRILCEQFAGAGDAETASYYRDASARLWFKISAISHVTPEEIEIYGGQPNKQCADYLTRHDPGRMIWNGYTGAAGWMFRQAIEGVVGARLANGEVTLPEDMAEPRGNLVVEKIERDAHLQSASSASAL